MDLRQHRPAEGVHAAIRVLLRLGSRAQHLRSGVLPLEPVVLPADVRARPGLSQGVQCQLVPQLPDRARQRAGRAGTVRALRHSGHQEEADAVVPQDHRLRRPPARRHGSARGEVAGEGAAHAAQLDRPIHGRRGRLRHRGPRRAGHRLHHAPRHALRRDLLRRCRRFRSRGGARRGHRGRGGIRGVFGEGQAVL